MTVTTLDVANDETMVIDTNAPDARSIMLASAQAIAACVIETEGKLAETAKAWGHALFRAVYVDNANLDSMIGDSKVAAGWSVLATNETGKKAKARLEVYFSNARKVAEAWGGMTDDTKADVLAGLSSIHYLAGQLRKAEADAKKAADKEAKRIKAEQEAADAKAQATESGSIEGETETVSFDVTGALEMLTLSFDDMSAADMAAIADHFNAMVAAYDSRLNTIVGNISQAA